MKQEQPDEVPPQTESEDSASALAAVSVKRDTGGGEECSAVETEPVTRLRQKRSATIASLQTPVNKQRRYVYHITEIVDFCGNFDVGGGRGGGHE